MAERQPIIPQGYNSSPAFSPGVQVGNLVFVSGQVSVDNQGNPVGAGDCAAQTRQVFSRIRAVVEAAGASMSDVVKITTFLTDVNNYADYNRVRSETFTSNPPASSTVIVAALVRPEFLVEVEAVVNLPGQ